MNALINRFLKEEDGVTAVEYGLIAGLMAAALVIGLGVLTNGINSAFNFIATRLTGLGT
ncbi:MULTISPECIES: Flp family type IVb pilin [unclassified Burkholderia]|uniref:Flp family type IVb pilin n=1 Tax=unclassified Burkholderia TaxID=2613784 RepID=UPI00141E5976|nr:MULTISPECIES: Flp family type IVb pilin [unclassified Burkholderia]NIE86315.1 Flp family type IVb pilin [Burkholderia sp. Tr-860]NIF66529.1 Flp family type IVb pilin [Burkholderia sp. Cy-647]NIF99052.1 Flp family type IVb pilin [Burkholderia sp. Ax-1720]